ncbi:MAG TPA: dienelactone hydrolase family protein [Caulobacteraceae bacterium]|nr:dienelactone hydrolase family protein [Caulobacteraceae bacterium]
MKRVLMAAAAAAGLMMIAGAANAQTVASLGDKGMDPASGKAPKQLVVFFHGYTQSGDAMKVVADDLAKRLPDAAFVFNDGPLPVGNGHSWYVLRGADPDNTKAKSKTLATDTVQKAMAGLKVKPENTVVVGFSQGGGVAFDGGSCQNPDVKAIVSLAGILDTADCAKQGRAANVLIVRNDNDPTVKIDMITAFQDQLKKLGYDPKLEQVSGNTHWPAPEGIKKAEDFIVAQLGGK